MMPNAVFIEDTFEETIMKHQILPSSPFPSSRTPLSWTHNSLSDLALSSDSTPDECYLPGNDFETSLQHVFAQVVSCPPPLTDRSPISEFWSPRLERDSSVVTVPSSPLSSIYTGPSTSESRSGDNLKIVQYTLSRKSRSAGRKIRINGSKLPKKRKFHSQSSRPDALKTEKAPKISIKLDVKGGIAGTECVFGLSQVIRATASKELQSATLVTRRVGACSRCRRHRIRCDMTECPYQPCGRCIKVSGNLNNQPCVRIDMLDLNLHRKGSTSNNALQLWVERQLELQMIKTWEHSSTHLLFITQDRGESFDSALSITVSRFEPGPDDKTGYTWEDSSGQSHTMEMPPYFISDIEKARKSVCSFIHQARPAYIDTLLADSEPIVSRTFQIAMAYTAFNQSSLISDALNCWVATRFIEGPWRIFCGGALLGLEPLNEPGNPFNGTIPVTPVIDTQLDDIFVRELLLPTSERLLKSLKSKIDEQKKENWLEIYLTMFIMMSNMGWVLKHVLTWTNRYGRRPGSRGGALTRGYIHTCKTLLSYFHFTCGGSIPLSVPWPEPDQIGNSHEGLTQDQIAYLRSIQRDVSRQEAKMVTWKKLSMYDDEMYWCYQLLCQDWRGDTAYIGDIDGFTEEDFLKTA
ncbi:hypothetical protein BKA64DRAFT_674136 [Cadophora sp. MPI-SDFR-AT-0126]|nr:hypothetical protein BKA64DRAFT_674136 [Leotiomycetes sp. MPI-SDFR-AT-0126]